MNFCFNYKEKNFEENYFLKKYKIGKYEDLEIKKINFINKYSIQDDNLYFTNKLQRGSGNRIEVLKKVINDLLLDPSILNNCFEGEDINQRSARDLKKLDRVDKILKLYDNCPNNELVYKYAPNSRYYKKYNNGDYERGFELLFTHTDNEVNIYLIDLYHLAILSKDQNINDDYEIRRKYKKDISECLFGEIKEQVTSK